MSEQYPHILHSDHFVTPFVGDSYQDALQKQADAFLDTTNPIDVDRVSVVIRTRNDVSGLLHLMEDLDSQIGRGDTQVIVVDTESTDGTRDVAKLFGAQVVSVSQENFSYPLALNEGFKRAEHPVVYSIVGHALLATTVAVAAGANHFKDETVGGVFVPPLPSLAASGIEKAISLGNGATIKKQARLTKAGVGVMGATNAMFLKDFWQEVGGFDLAFAGGGEDGDMARKMTEAGLTIVNEPLVAVHHSHGLGFKDTVRQWKHWMSLGKPTPFSTEEIAKRRPDLHLDS